MMIPHSRPTLGEEEKKACLEVLDSGQIAQGQKVEAFERRFAEFVNRRYAVAVSSGTSALVLSLLALDVSQGDEVIFPSFTCVALLHAVEAAGARPVLVDIDSEDFNISVFEVKKKIRRRTKAVIVPHMFGFPAQIKDLLDLGIFVIEDGTQALGAEVDLKPVGSFGPVSLFSFYATKMMTTGEGGMVLTDSARLAQKLSDLRDYDKKVSYHFRTNSKMTDLEAAIGIEQLKKLPLFVERRREIAFRYHKALEGQAVTLPRENSERSHVYYRYVIRMPRKSKKWLIHMHELGVDVKKPIFKPLHRYLHFSDALFPNTSQAMKETYSLPIYPSLGNAECDQICRILRGEILQEIHVQV